jgi:hypothetical protein
MAIVDHCTSREEDETNSAVSCGRGCHAGHKRRRPAPRSDQKGRDQIKQEAETQLKSPPFVRNCHVLDYCYLPRVLPRIRESCLTLLRYLQSPFTPPPPRLPCVPRLSLPFLPQTQIPIFLHILTPHPTKKSMSVMSVQRHSPQAAICQGMHAFTRESAITSAHFLVVTPAVLVKTIFNNSEYHASPQSTPACILTLVSSYRIHLTPGSRRNSASARAHVMSGTKKHVKAPSVPEAAPDSPPSTPPALELAFVPRVYSSEPSPSMSNLSILYPPPQEYVKQDYQEAVPQPHYFDPRGSPNCGFPRDACIQPAGSELGSFSSQHRIYTSSAGGLVMAESNPISDMSNTATYGVYGACPPPNHPPPDRLSPTQSIDTSMHADVSLVQPQPRSNLRGLPLRTNLQSIQPHQSPIPSPNSPSPVSSLSMSSHSSEHSPSAYQKHNLAATAVSGMRYPPPQVQNDYTITEHYHSSQFLPTEAEYRRAISTSSWQNRLSDVRGMPATPGEGVEFVL